MNQGKLFAAIPHWITARYKGKCANNNCGAKLSPGDKAWYWPASRELYCQKCGHLAAIDFNQAQQDEEFMRGQFARPF